MYNFTFHRPETLRQAVNLLSKNEDAKLLAGGHTLLPTMKLRLASPPQLIDLSRVEGLAGIELKGRALVIGAMTRHVASKIVSFRTSQSTILGTDVLALFSVVAPYDIGHSHADYRLKIDFCRSSV